MRSFENNSTRDTSKASAYQVDSSGTEQLSPPKFQISVSTPPPVAQQKRDEEHNEEILSSSLMEGFEENTLETISNTNLQNPSDAPIQRATFVEGSIVGHASPRWEHTRGQSRADLNLQLSRERAENVETYFREIFLRQMGSSAADVSFAIQSTAQNHDNPSELRIPSTGVGDQQTLEEAGGDTNANEQQMRRVDLSIVITHQIEGEAGYTEQVVIPEECQPHATNQWSIKMAIGGGAGHAGVGGAFAMGKLKNRRTGQIAEGSFIGGGIGVGLQTPGVDPGWGDWTDFTTEDICTFDDFDFTLARLTSAGAGIALIGYSATWISFPLRGANSIYVGGFNMGALGADAGSNVGEWNIHGRPPGPVCTPERVEGRDASSPYQFDIFDNLSHSVFYETGESEMDDDELRRLEAFVTQIVGQYASSE